MAKDKTPKTPEQKAAAKAAHAARERERYALAKKAGLSRDEARSLKKAIDQLPDVLQDPTEGILDLIGGVRGLAKSIFKFGVDLTAGQLPTIGHEEAPPEPTGKKKTRPRKDQSSFLDFLSHNPDLSANQAIKKFRSQGGKIGNETGKDLFREQRGNVKQVIRKTRFRYYSNDEKPLFGSADRKLIKDRYMYLVQYELEMEEGTDRTDWQYIASNEPLTLREIKEATLQQWEDGVDSGSEKYKAIRIIPESIELIHAVDTSL